MKCKRSGCKNNAMKNDLDGYCYSHSRDPQMVSKRKNPRKKVGVDTRVTLLTESVYKCGVPTCRNVIALDMHHIVHVEEGGGNEPSNLLPLCGFCHSLYNRGEIKRQSIKAWKILLMSINNAFDRKSIDILLMLSTLGTASAEFEFEDIYVSGDGLLECASLIASGFVEATSDIVRKKTGEFLIFPIHSTTSAFYKLNLTDKGRSFIDSWKNGDLSALDYVGSDVE